MKNERFILLSVITVLFCVNVHSQDNGMYMVPPTVYVGDRASLVLPLQNFSERNNIELTGAQIPVSPDIDIYRIATERRPGGSRLIVEFSAYRPGVIEIPPFEIADRTFDGLKIEIVSILDSDGLGTVLSGPAAVLAVPGTSLLVYGTLSVVILLPLLTLLILFKGRNLVKVWMAAWRRKRLIAVMRKIERHLRMALARNSSIGDVLDTLSKEFRIFLEFFTGENCRAMTASEIGRITLYGEGAGNPDENPGGNFLGGFFACCDRLRFSGTGINGYEALSLLNDLGTFLKTLETTERKRISVRIAA